MYRSWAYILMVVATLAGVVALLWPSPPVRTIGEIAMPARGAAVRAEAPAKAAKSAQGGAKQGARAEPAPVPPAVLKRIPLQNTSTKRAGPPVQNGLQPNNSGKPPAEGARLGGQAPAARPPARPGTAVTARPAAPSRPSPPPEKPSRQPAPR
jgi:hypothetical protein